MSDEINLPRYTLNSWDIDRISWIRVLTQNCGCRRVVTSKPDEDFASELIEPCEHHKE